jgi:thiamine pyrophosphate-dependent acetolactate synthase large subunit-like protein
MTRPASVQGTNAGAPQWGSDVVAQFLRNAEVPYIALNPGASFRGLHDSLVNFLHDQEPRMLVCLHEEHAVALAHGYAKVTGQPLAVALHSNVGLMHASMAIYNAWVDRVPVFLVGATGPVDAAKRRPWIDWIHTASDQAALVRPYVKWDDQPMSVDAIVESLARAWEIVRTPPHGPTYVVLDAAVQEQPLSDPVPPLPAVRTGPVADVPVASAASVRRAAQLLQQASRPVVLMGRVSREASAWERRVHLVELLGARVITDLKAGAAFPTRHEAHVPGPGFFLSSAGKEALAAADVVLALDWIDLAGTMKQAPVAGDRRIVSVTLDPQLHNGWSKDHQGYLSVDVTLPTRPDTAVDQLVAALEPRPTPARPHTRPPTPEDVCEDAMGDGVTDPQPIELPVLARLLRRAVHRTATCLVRLPLGWDGDDWPFDHPLDYLGYDGGGGIGSGPGMLVGAALALRGSGRFPLAVLGDGDYLMGVQALWTAAHEQIPLLAVVANNRSYFNDEVHQERVARVRDRDVSRRWVGQRIDDPAPDLAALARAQGLEGIGPVSTVEELAKALPAAVALVRDGRPVVVDVVVEPGYTPAMSSGLTRTS